MPKSHRPWWDGGAYCAGSCTHPARGMADRRRGRSDSGQAIRAPGGANVAEFAEATGVPLEDSEPAVARPRGRR
jgi:hypothetical protein